MLVGLCYTFVLEKKYYHSAEKTKGFQVLQDVAGFSGDQQHVQLI